MERAGGESESPLSKIANIKTEQLKMRKKKKKAHIKTEGKIEK